MSILKTHHWYAFRKSRHGKSKKRKLTVDREKGSAVLSKATKTSNKGEEVRVLEHQIISVRWDNYIAKICNVQLFLLQQSPPQTGNGPNHKGVATTPERSGSRRCAHQLP